MVLNTKERIIAHRSFSSMRYIRSLHPVLYISGRRDFGGTDVFRSDDAYSHLCTRAGALWTPQGYTFTGAPSNNDSINLGNNAVLNFTGSFSLASWIKNNAAAPTADHQAIMSKVQVATAFEYAMFLTVDGYARISLYQADSASYGGVTGAVDLTDNIWHHIAAVFTSATKLELFVDSISVGSITSFTGTRGSSTANLYVGMAVQYTNAWGFAGTVGEIEGFNTALTANEIMKLYLATKWRQR